MLPSDIIYDFEKKGSKKPVGSVIYDDPIEERENKFTTGELDKMHVDEEYKIKPSSVSRTIIGFLGELRAHFRGQKLVTYQEIMDYARKHVSFVAKDYPHNSHPAITQWMNTLWKAGLIDKYRRGLWASTYFGLTRGISHGVTFDLRGYNEIQEP